MIGIRSFTRFLPGARRAAEVLAEIERMPLAGIVTLTHSLPILFLAPHPDDESLGCGGAIALARESGTPAHVMILTDGAASHPGSGDYPPSRLAKLRVQEARAAVAELGVASDRIRFLGLPDGAAGRSPARQRKTVSDICDYVRSHGIATICTTWHRDPHPDHQAAFRIAKAVARRCDVRLLAYIVWGWTLPPDQRIVEPGLKGFRIDIQPSLPAKRRAIACHRSQITNLIGDVTCSIVVPSALLEKLDRPFEAFLEAR